MLTRTWLVVLLAGLPKVTLAAAQSDLPAHILRDRCCQTRARIRRESCETLAQVLLRAPDLAWLGGLPGVAAEASARKHPTTSTARRAFVS